MTDYLFDLAAFGAHPDDVEFSCAGLLIKLGRLGYRTAVVDLTEGEMGSRGDVPLRRKEAAAAAAVMGLAHRENLGLPDGSLNGYASASPEGADSAQLQKTVSCLRRLRPEVVVIPYGKCRHPDHAAASMLLTRAIFMAGLHKYHPEEKAYVPNQVVYYQMRYQFRPSFVVDISEVSREKLQALQCYSSQLGLGREGKFESDPAAPETLIASPLTLSSLEARDRYFGAMIGTTHAEAFLTRNAVPVDDPVAHFRRNSGKAALVFPEEI